MPVIKILKDGKELASILIPDEFEIRIVHADFPVHAQLQQQVAPSTHVTELTATIPPVPATPTRAATEQVKPEPRKVDETKEVVDVMKEAIARAEETSKKLASAVEKEIGKGKEGKEDIAMIRKVLEELLSQSEER